MKTFRKIFFISAMITFVAFGGCEKENIEPEPEENIKPEPKENGENNNGGENNYNSVITISGEIIIRMESGSNVDEQVEKVEAGFYDNEYILATGKFQNGESKLQLEEVPTGYLHRISDQLDKFNNSEGITISDESTKISSLEGVFFNATKGGETTGYFLRTNASLDDVADDELLETGGSLALFMYSNKAVNIKGKVTDKLTYSFDLNIRKGWNEIILQGKRSGKGIMVIANDEPSGMKWQYIPKAQANSAVTAKGEINAVVENGATLINIIDYVKASIEDPEFYEVGLGQFKNGGFILQLNDVPDKYLYPITEELEDLDNLQISDRSAKISNGEGVFIETFRGNKQVGQFARVKGPFTNFDHIDKFWANGGTLGIFIYSNKAVKVSGELIDDKYDHITYLHDFQLRKGWNELVAQSKWINNKLQVSVTANNEPEGMKWVFVPKNSLNDFYNSYTIQYKKGLNIDFSTYSPVVISPYYDNDGTEWAFIEGLYEGKFSFTAYGKWDAREQSILLQGGIYAKRKFSFKNDPTTYYYAVFYPVTYYPYVDVLNYLEGGDNNAGEARLVMNDDGTISYKGGSSDENNETANGFIYRYYSAETDEYNGRFVVCYDITLTPDYSSSRVKPMASLLGKKQQDLILKRQNQASHTSDRTLTSTETFPVPPFDSCAIYTAPSPLQTVE